MKRVAIVAAMVLASVFAGCADHPRVTAPLHEASGDATIPPVMAPLVAYTGDWTNNVLSETRYALSRSRSGTSSLTRNGLYMGDWNYVSGGTDPSALQKITQKYSGPAGTGTYGFHVYAQGGWCKFFVDLVLYRSSYGLSGGYHLTLPSGYTYAQTDVRRAGPGWVIQSALPHTAIIDAPYRDASGAQIGWWVIDANWVGSGTTNMYWIAKHPLSFSTLNAYGFRAWLPSQMSLFP